MISTDVYPPGALHHARPLQDVVVGLPLHLMLEGTHFALCFSICQIPCEAEKESVRHLQGCIWGHWSPKSFLRTALTKGPHPICLITIQRFSKYLELVKGGGITVPVASTRAGLITSMVSVQNFSKSGMRLGSWNRLMWMSDTLNQTYKPKSGIRKRLKLAFFQDSV